MLLQRFRLRPFTETVILITQEREELHMKKIVLASASPRRRELLSQVGVAFEVKPASGEERITSAEPAKVVEELSAQKAAAVWEKFAVSGVCEPEQKSEKLL